MRRGDERKSNDAWDQFISFFQWRIYTGKIIKRQRRITNASGSLFGFFEGAAGCTFAFCLAAAGWLIKACFDGLTLPLEIEIDKKKRRHRRRCILKQARRWLSLLAAG